jgi:hypothetical protein
MFLLILGCFVAVPYVLIIKKNIATEKSIIPYVVLIGMHVLGTCLYFAEDPSSNNDAAGSGLSGGLLGLAYIAANIGLAFVAWVVFLVRKRLDAVAQERRRWG